MDNVNRIRVGFFAPDFVGRDSEGEKFSISDFRGRKNLLLFFCHGRRCDFCLEWLEEFNRLYDDIQMRDTEILAFSPDERWNSKRIKRERDIRFPILKIEGESKSGNPSPRVTQQYGIEAKTLEEESLYPAIFLVDKRGIIRLRRVYTQPSHKPQVKELLSELEELI